MHRWPETSFCHAATQSHPDEQSPRIAHWRSVSIPVLHSVRVPVVHARVDCALQSHCRCPVPSTGTWCWVCKTKQTTLVVFPLCTVNSSVLRLSKEICCSKLWKVKEELAKVIMTMSTERFWTFMMRLCWFMYIIKALILSLFATALTKTKQTNWGR